MFVDLISSVLPSHTFDLIKALLAVAFVLLSVYVYVVGVSSIISQIKGEKYIAHLDRYENKDETRVRMRDLHNRMRARDYVEPEEREEMRQWNNSSRKKAPRRSHGSRRRSW